MLMDSEKINELLTRYWSCETSLEEEQELREYFKGEEIPPEWRETAALFQYFGENRKKSLRDVSFDKRVLEKVRPASEGRVKMLVHNAMRIAAGLVVVMMSIWFIRNEVRKSTPQTMVDTYDDPKLAFEETKKALMMISKSFGTVEERAKRINMFNEAQEDIQKKKETKL